MLRTGGPQSCRRQTDERIQSGCPHLHHRQVRKARAHSLVEHGLGTETLDRTDTRQGLYRLGRQRRRLLSDASGKTSTVVPRHQGKCRIKGQHDQAQQRQRRVNPQQHSREHQQLQCVDDDGVGYSDHAGHGSLKIVEAGQDLARFARIKEVEVQTLYMLVETALEIETHAKSYLTPEKSTRCLHEAKEQAETCAAQQ